jgi:hypothetical protein
LTVGDYLNIGLPGDRITSSTILTITGPAPSTYRFTLPVSVGTYGPLTSGTYSDRLNGSGASERVHLPSRPVRADDTCSRQEDRLQKLTPDLTPSGGHLSVIPGHS